MSNDALSDPFRIDDLPWDLPPGVEDADPAQRMIDDLRRVNKLRSMLQENRAENRKAWRTFLLKLLEVADALERMLARQPNPESKPETQQWNSIRVTRRLLDQVLKLQGVEPIEMIGKVVDENLCEVEHVEERTDLPDGTVTREVIKGYRWGNDPAPLRLAVVVISVMPRTDELETDA